MGYDVSMAESGMSAVSLLNIGQPDLIVTDINMPKMSGLELISHVRAQYPAISVIAMSDTLMERLCPQVPSATGSIRKTGTGTTC